MNYCSLFLVLLILVPAILCDCVLEHPGPGVTFTDGSMMCSADEVGSTILKPYYYYQHDPYTLYAEGEVTSHWRIKANMSAFEVAVYWLGLNKTVTGMFQSQFNIVVNSSGVFDLNAQAEFPVGYSSWNETNSPFYGQCPTMKCPASFPLGSNGLPILSKDQLGLVGGCMRIFSNFTAWNPYYPPPSYAYKLYPYPNDFLCRVGPACKPPIVDPGNLCDLTNMCPFKAAGCVPLYPTITDCNNNTQTLCKAGSYDDGVYSTILDSASTHVGYGPRLSPDKDPEMCFKDGVFNKQCQKNFMSGGPVSGSDIFCALYPCVPSPCYCSFVSVEEYFNATIGGVSDYGGSIEVLMIEDDAPVHFYEKHYPRENCVIREPITATLDHHVLSTYFNSHAQRSIIMEKDSMVEMFECESKKCQWELPESFFVSNGELRVSASLGSCKSEIAIVKVYGETHCSTRNCILCWESVEDWDCVPPFYKTVFIMTWIAIGLFIICAFPWIIWGALAGFLRLLLIPVLIWNSCSGSQLSADTADMIKRWIEYTTKPMQSKIRRPTGTELAILMAVLPLILASPHCDKTTYTSIMSTVCSPNTQGGLRDCVGEVVTSVILPSSGSSVCLVAVSNNTGDPAMTIVLSRTTTTDTLDFETVYWTSAWKAATQTRLRCHNWGHCSEENCVNPGFTGHGNLDKPAVVNRPGQVFCSLRCTDVLGGLMHCACPLTAPNCLFTGYGITPVGDIFAVKQLMSRFVSPSLHLEVWNHDGKIAEMDISGRYESETFKVEFTNKLGVIGSVIPDDIYMIENSGTFGDTYLAFASRFDIPEVGKIGDIQASQPSLLQNPTSGSFTYNQAILQELQYYDDRAIFRFANVGLTQGLTGATLLPGKLPGTVQTWNKVSPTRLVSESLFTEPLEVILTSTAVIFVESFNPVCPEIKEIKHIDGCFSCQSGVSMEVEVRSKCSAGAAYVSIEDENVSLRTEVIFLSTDWKTLTINFEVDDANVGGKLCISADEKDCKKFSGRVAEVVLRNVTINGETRQISTKKKHGDDRGDWDPFRISDSVFMGNGKMWEWAIFLIIIGVMLIGLFFIVPMIIPSYTKATLGVISEVKKFKSSITPDKVPAPKKERIPEPESVVVEDDDDDDDMYLRMRRKPRQ